MFVCICNGHRDADIRRVAETGVSCARQIYRRLGKPVRCGRCLEFAAGVIAEVHTTVAPLSEDDRLGERKVAATG